MKNITDSYLIAWQKWFDPFGDDDHDELNNYEGINETDNDEENLFTSFSQKPFKAISTPMGIIPYTENTASGKIFNFWIGHTNFNITKDIMNIIEFCEGVETLDVFTRYRFRIAVGKAFDETIVKSVITKNIYDFLNDNQAK